MHISQLRIRNYRNFHSARFVFEKGVNTLIGENGSGKSNALTALRLLIDDSLARNSVELSDTDFCRGLGLWKGHWIIISLDFAELDASEGCQLLRHNAANMDGSATGGSSLIMRPRKPIRQRLHELGNAGDPAAVLEYRKSLSLNDYETIITGRGTADFADDRVYAELAGDFEASTFPNPEGEDTNLIGVKVFHPICVEVSCTFAPALRDVVNDLRGMRRNPLLALLRGSEATIQISDATAIVTAAAALNTRISGLPEVKRIESGVQGTLYDTVGHAYSPEVAVESVLPETIDRLIQRLTVKVLETGGATFKEELADQSLGGANLIYLALKLLEFDIKQSSDRVAHFLLIEEPEAHLHTHVKKTLFDRQSGKTQVIVSTHSTHVSSASRIRSVNVLARQGEVAAVFQPANGLSERQIEGIERYLDAVRSTLLFAKGVVLVEGDAEMIVAPALLKAVFGIKPDELGVSVISVASAFFDHLAVLFDDQRVRRKCAIVTDLDAPLTPLPADDAGDTAQMRSARKAAKRGESRRHTLDALAAANRWVRPFYSPNTFETEFIGAGNHAVCVDLVDEVYAQAAKRASATADLLSGELARAGGQFLEMAEYVGKGWLALMTAARLPATASIPEYLLRAFAFAAPHQSKAVHQRMLLHRLRTGAVLPAAGAPTADELAGLAPAAALQAYEATLVNDVLGRFIAFSSEYEVV